MTKDKEQKVWYNVNVNDSRVEQFETLEEAQAYLEKQIKPYITKSLYVHDAMCDCWDEIEEANVKGSFTHDNT